MEVDEREKSLLITWLPVTLASEDLLSSSSVPVLGYCVYLDGVEVNLVHGAAGTLVVMWRRCGGVV